MNFSLLYRLMPVLLVLTIVLASCASAQMSTCTDLQMKEMPCRCCKMQCWMAISKSATHELGHIPGQEGEQEALATLKLIRACMIQECASTCTRKTPFRPAALANLLLEAREKLQESN